MTDNEIIENVKRWYALLVGNDTPDNMLKNYRTVMQAPVNATLPQQYITWLKQQLYLYEQAEENHARGKRYNEAYACNWSAIILRLCLQKVELLLSEEITEAQNPPPKD